MSIKLVGEEISRFLESSEAEAICIMGQWGAGKTFTWRKYLEQATKTKKIGLERYSYVSLFGQNSIEDLKYSIFENTVLVSEGQVVPTTDTLLDNLKYSGKFIEKWGRKTLKWGGSLLGSIPKINEYLPLATKSFFLTVRNQIICIDDLERRGPNLSTKEVLGLVSFLKEERKCKVVLLLNDSKLEGKDATDFREQMEKVMDVEMHFVPTPQEATEVGIDKPVSFKESFSQIVESLRIVNIRVIRKILKLTERLEKLLENHNKKIFESAVPSMVLFGWMVYQEEEAPSIDFIKDFNPLSHLFDKSKPESEESKKWRPLLSSINFNNFDELDQLLLESIQAGYFDPNKVEKVAQDYDKKFEAQEQDNSFSKAWELYHGSFSDNQNEVLDAMFNAVKNGAKAISPSNLDSSIVLFRKLNREAQADEMIGHYMNKRSDEKREFFDPSRSVFLELKDQNFKKAFDEKLNSYKDGRKPEDILFDIAKNGGWNPEDVQTLAKISVDDYFTLFKGLADDKLRVVVSQALKFGRYDNSDPNYKEVSSRAEQALKKIGKENPLNKMRVATYGINAEEEVSS